MAKDSGSLDALKKAFSEGFEAFNKVEQNDRRYWVNPPNPYPSKALTHKEWMRGYDRAFWEQQRKAERADLNEAKA